MRACQFKSSQEPVPVKLSQGSPERWRPSNRLAILVPSLILAVFALAVLPVHGQTFSCNPPMANQIVCENSKTGNPASEWDVSGSGDASIQGFATDISVNQGGIVHFKIKTPASSYRIDIYRMGYYGGLGARKVASVLPSATLPQTQPACLTDATTGLMDCGNWAESASWAVPVDATSGIYFARPVRLDTGGASHIFFVVRSDSGNSALLFQTSDTTWQAYNNYGGNNLYTGSPAGRAYKVSYNRPFVTRSYSSGQSWIFNAEYPMVRWLEANGYDISYFTGVDADRSGSLILRHKVFLSVGHDEYWSAAQRANVEGARAAGVHLAFFSGNEVFWKIRWENSIAGPSTPYRTLVCYKETHAGQPIDPQDPPTWTGTWRDPRFSPPADGGRPENALTGTIFYVNGPRGDAITVPAIFGKMRFWRNTSVAALTPGAVATMPNGTLGYEWDQDVDNGFRPASLVDLSSTTIDIAAQYLLDYGSTYGAGTATHSLTLYRSSGGSLVFGAGTVQWSWGLDNHHDNGNTAPDPSMQQATVNLFADMGVQPATLQPGLTPASASTDSIAPSSVITSPAAGSSVQIANTVTVTGTATDAGAGVVAAVEVSVDGGTTWRPAVGLANWSYTWTPTALGSVTLKSRGIDDSLNVEVPSSGVTVTVVADTTPPVISAVQVGTVTNTWAFISWTTNEPGDSQVQYGPTTAYGASTTLDPTLVTNHTVVVNGLAPSTLYHFRVKSRDSSGNLGTSSDFTFTTTATSSASTITFDDLPGANYVLSGQYPTGMIDWGTGVWWLSSPWGKFTTKSISFNGTGIVKASFTFLSRLRLLQLDAYNGGTTSTTITVSCPGQVNKQTTLLAGQLTTIPTGWNDACSPVSIASTNGWDTNFDNLVVDSPPSTPPVISAVQAGAITCGSATITWTTDRAADSQVDYGPTSAYGSSTVLDPMLVTSHSVALNGLAASTLYHYRVKSKDSGGNLSTSGDFTFTTGAPDPNPPVISGVQAVAITNSGAYITWTTDKNADSQVEYGTSTAYGSSTPLNSAMVTSHTVTLGGLTANTLYHYRVKSKDACGNLATSADSTFSTTNTPPLSLWSSSTLPAVASSTDTAAVELGVKFTSDVDGYLTGFRFYKGTANTGTHVGSLWTSAGSLLASATFTNETASGWQQVTFASPVAITANTVYVTSYHTNVGGYAINQSYFSGVGFDNPPLHALRDGLSGGNGVFLYGPGGFPTQTFNGSNYWVDVVFAASSTVPPPPITVSISPTSASVQVGMTQQFTATVQNTTNTAVTWQVNGITGGNATIGTISTTGLYTAPSTVPTPATVTVTAVSQADTTKSASATVTVTAAPPPVTVSISPTSASVQVGMTQQFTATVQNTTNTAVTWQVNGITGGNATIGTISTTGLYTAPSTVPTPATVTVTAVSQADTTKSASATVTVTAAPPSTTPPTISNVQALRVSSSNATITWTTDKLADSQVEYGTTTAYGSSTPLDTTLVTSHSLTLGGLTANTLYHYRVKSTDGSGNPATSADFTFTTPYTLWSDVTAPAVTSASDTSAVELGVKFTSDVSGAITGLRFYKGTANTGTHVGSLWTSAGSLLASATFTNETASGWQQVIFASPVAITANTVYVASYHTNTGGYSLDQLYFNGKAYDNPPLHALKDGGATGGNGVFLYGPGSFPTQSFNQSNYWVDVLFTVVPDTTPPTISAVQATAITASGATIIWSTNEPGNSQVEYGTTTAYGSSTPLNTALVTNHSLALSGLTANTFYHYRVKSTDGSGNPATSADFTFTTLAPDTTPPIISAVQARAITASGATITWSTDEPGDSQVEYGTTTAYGSSTTLDPTLVMNHSVTLSGLTANTLYHYRVKSKDASGNLATSADFTFSTSSTAPLSLWSSSTLPAVASAGDASAVELGVKFTSDVNGFITGLRFYKGPSNAGTHVGSLWTSAGSLLASATFTNETASGWQQVTFASPVAITANTVYVASYHTNTGGYSIDQLYFMGKSFDNPPLHALKDGGATGGNGVFLYGPGSFPTQSFNQSNYWVDVLFIPQ